MKKGIMSFVSGVLAISVVAGCSSSNNNEGGSSSSPSPSLPASATKAEPATLTFGTYHVPADSRDDFDQTAVGKAIKEKLNITLKIRGSQNVEQDFVADMAANNLPDIFMVTASSTTPQSLEMMTKAAKEGMLADLTDYIQKTDILKDVMKPNRMPLYTSNSVFNPEFNGKVHFLPAWYSTKEPALNGFGLYLRGDIAKQLNFDTLSIRTPDDLYQLAKKVKEGNFKDVNGKPVYPIGMISAWNQNLYQLFRGFDYGKSGFALIDGKIKSFIESEQIWQQIQFVRKLVAEGLIDQESFAHSYQIGSEKVAQGRNAVMPYLAEGVVQTLADTHPEMKYVALSPMNDFTGSSDQVINLGMEPYLMIGVSKKTNVEAAVRLLDWLNTKEGRATVGYGAKDQQWTFVDKGLAKMKDEVFAEMQADTTAFQIKYGTGSKLEIPALITGFDAAYDIYGGNLRNPWYLNNKEVYDKVDAYIKVVMPKLVVKNQLDISMLMTNYPQKDQLMPVLQQLKDILARCYLAKTDKEAQDLLEGYRSTLNKNGYQEYIQFLQKEYDKDPSVYLVSSGTY
ncbi:hypothetical protein [Paenibacillus contaminans]|uniref:ABC transporter substrate-binding protein n=1 Tax=Paenibacillus contaminans TaxID=450362 RepID=A0A329MTL6_9BACL|nr:hypothetical protein [Paenibacillus contaminans]RAV22952.1 hypothetical protein DQG23_01745 [Paenibacillus contaminans]